MATSLREQLWGEMSKHPNGTSTGSESTFPRGKSLPSQSPLFWVQQKDRYLRQLLIADIEAMTGRRLVVYFANRFKQESFINAGDIPYVAELLGDLGKAPADLLLETNGGETDATEAIVSLLQSTVPDLRVIVTNAAKSNGTVICLAASEIIMGPTSELGPIDPSVGGMPASIAAEPIVAQQNYALHRLAAYAIMQTTKLATSLLKNGMLAGKSDQEVGNVVAALSTKNVFHSHGSVVDHREATALGLAVRYLPEDDELWRRIWLLHCMYAQDITARNHLKIFEGRARSTSVAAP
ncbi:ClpP class periplasmic serine protease [Neorhizobium galegae bv. orientalis]|nr:ClpP class periplasmic serine protease [Neorhizobium galegae bv. orientalis]